jgi:uncharacterized membrane protein YeaQ/YmgE (transglycosylase-associated protein family)
VDQEKSASYRSAFDCAILSSAIAFRLSSFVKSEEASAESIGRNFMGILTWIIVGLIAGWLAGQVMKGGGYGVLVDIILGILGGVVGGWVFGALGIWPGGGLVGAIIVAFVGAVILVGLTRLIKRA